jgi:hypothetical protein
MALVLYNSFTVPLAFSFGLPNTVGFNASDWVLTGLYTLDIAVNFRTAFHDDVWQGRGTQGQQHGDGWVELVAFGGWLFTADRQHLVWRACKQRMQQVGGEAVSG